MKNFKYPNDPLHIKCPYCGKFQIECSNINNMTRAYARNICAKKHNYIKIHNTDNIIEQ
jgi:hypothetical protein